MLSKYRRIGVEIKLIDRNLERCKEASEIFPGALVLHGSGTDLDFLRQENIDATDVFIAVSGNDEVNILSALLAKKLGVKKTIVEINRPDYAMLVETLDIDTTIRPRLLTASRILKLVRKGSIVSVTILGEDQAEIIEINVGKDAPAQGKTLQELDIPNGVLVGSIVRGKKAIIPRGSDQIKAGDRIVLFCLPELSQQITEMFSG
jgi:trk system potassium uptake protein TrkA